MVDDPPRRRAPLIRLGTPGPYVLFAACATAGWFPIRLFEDSNPAQAVLSAGAGGVVWGLFPLLMGVMPRVRRRAEAERDVQWARTREALRRGEAPTDEAGRAAVADHLPATRRGALVGAAGGTLLFGGLAVVALAAGWATMAGGYGLVLVAVLAFAVRTLARVRRLRARLASGQRG